MQTLSTTILERYAVNYNEEDLELIIKVMSKELKKRKSGVKEAPYQHELHHLSHNIENNKFVTSWDGTGKRWIIVEKGTTDSIDGEIYNIYQDAVDMMELNGDIMLGESSKPFTSHLDPRIDEIAIMEVRAMLEPQMPELEIIEYTGK